MCFFYSKADQGGATLELRKLKSFILLERGFNYLKVLHAENRYGI